ncbi:MAG TPA: discoidin domain-containing protein, partial [Cyclobacteriaceae bacterium]|nr:discoidin domain-containing protein [Cyclobacteriaceae bacterium]
AAPAGAAGTPPANVTPAGTPGAAPAVAGAPGAPGAGRGNGFAQRPQIQTSPRAYQVQVSADGSTWTTVAEGKGAAKNNISFAPVQAKFIRINQTDTATDGAAWTMNGMKIFEAGK